MKKRVVVTGMEIISSIGIGIESFWKSAIKGKSGINRIKNYDPTPYPTQIAGEIQDLPTINIPKFKNKKYYPKVTKYAIYCTQQAIKTSNLTTKELNRAGIFIGTSLGGIPELESAYQTFYKINWKKIPALSILKGMPNSIANHIAILFNIKGINSTTSNACISSAEAIKNAYEQILHGNLNIAICGGSESLLWETIMASWCKLRIMSTQNTNPKKACKPFDINRDGMVIAEGAGILILEELNHAKTRGAKIIAEIIGIGCSCDAYHITIPNSKGQEKAIFKAIKNAKINISDIQYIHAHGTGTKLNDIIETQTIKNIFGNKAYEIPITAQKSMIGHTIGASGVMQIIAIILSLKNNILLPTINLNNPDPKCDLDYIPNIIRKKNIHIALSNHFAFGGSNIAIILKKYCN
ncbi:beta-ketoacyl-[acyl-carrier-protein] synthase family protein [Candidatus Legionella polyplacis]|uniref:Nodulation protein E n=1 Tax=Candidatus Legionella polyplacis TaxID=2005262 RepID=A0ABZ2GZY0_9GAMM